MFDQVMKSKTAQSALTLVELLVVIAIIAMLTALLLTAISRGKARAQSIVCLNNIRQLHTALQQFVGEKHVYPLWINPSFLGHTRNEAFENNYADHEFAWIDTLGTELEKPRDGRDFKGVWICPSAKPPVFTLGSKGGWSFYGYNAGGMSSQRLTDTNSFGLGGRFVWRSTGRPQGPLVPPVSESEVASPSDMMAIGDGFVGSGGFVADGEGGLGRMPITIATSGYLRTAAAVARAKVRHQGKANVVFCDGHVESPTLKFLFEDTNDAALVRWNRDHLAHRDRL